MCNTIAHHLLVGAQYIPEQWLVTPGQLPSVYTLNMTLFVMESPFVLYASAVLAVPPPVSCAPAHVAEHRKLKSL